MNLEKIAISKYSNAYLKNNVVTNVLCELNYIKNGEYKSLIEKCRALRKSGHLQEYKAIKSKLPALTFCGLFEAGHKKEDLSIYSQFVIIDIDELIEAEVEEIKQKLFSDKHIIACWKSPSGVGIKLLIYVNSTKDFHKNAFDSISEYIYKLYDIEVDKSGSDYSRLCYVSHDENLLLDANKEIFIVEITNDDIEKKARHLNKKQNTIPAKEMDIRYLYDSTEGRNRTSDRNKMRVLIKFLKKHNKSITNTYKDWVLVALSIANTFTYEIGKKYFLSLSMQDLATYDEDRCSELLEYCYRNRRTREVNFGTIIHLASLQGFDIQRVS